MTNYFVLRSLTLNLFVRQLKPKVDGRMVFNMLGLKLKINTFFVMKPTIK